MEEVTAQRVLAVSATRLWAFLCDPHHLAQINPNSEGASDVEPPGPLQVGQRWTELMRTPVGRQEVHTVVTAADADPGCIALRSLGPAGIVVEAEISVRSDAPQQSTVTFTNRFALDRGGFLQAMAGSFLRPAMQEASQIALDRLADELR